MDTHYHNIISKLGNYRKLNITNTHVILVEIIVKSIHNLITVTQKCNETAKIE